MRKAVIELFQVLDTKPEDRDPYMEESLCTVPVCERWAVCK